MGKATHISPTLNLKNWLSPAYDCNTNGIHNGVVMRVSRNCAHGRSPLKPSASQLTFKRSVVRSYPCPPFTPRIL